ncbi:MAG TPA: hypothetical protein VGF99_21400 [Myxococcota bacterium]
MRQSHRWLSIIFTLFVIMNFVVMGMGRQVEWVTYAPLPPLFLMIITGLYLLVQPWIAKRRNG